MATRTRKKTPTRKGSGTSRKATSTRRKTTSRKKSTAARKTTARSAKATRKASSAGRKTTARKKTTTARKKTTAARKKTTTRSSGAAAGRKKATTRKKATAARKAPAAAARKKTAARPAARKDARPATAKASAAKPAAAPASARPQRKAPTLKKRARERAGSGKSRRAARKKRETAAVVMPPTMGTGATPGPDRSRLGTKYTCFKCGTKFYDMNRPEPTCTRCGADQREAPKASDATPAPRPAERPRPAVPRPMAPLLDDEEDAVRSDEEVELGIAADTDDDTTPYEDVGAVIEDEDVED